MKKIFIGSIFVFLSLNISLGRGSLGLAPDFVGYILLLLGTNELMRKEQGAFPVLRSVDILLKVLIVASAVDYVLDLFGVALVASSVEGVVWKALLAAGDCYCWKKLIGSVGKLEEEYGKDLNTLRLTTAWWIYTISAVLTIVAIFVTNATIYCIIIGLAITAPLYFLAQTYKLYKVYQGIVRK